MLAVPRFITDDGVGLYYEIWATGEPILFYIPSWAEPLESRRWIEPLAAEGIGIVAYDRRGTGRSDRPQPTEDNYTVERLTSDAVQLADSLDSRPLVALAGFEAAHQAVRLAAARPARVAGLVLMGPMLAPVAERPLQVMWEGLIEKGMPFALRSVADLGALLAGVLDIGIPVQWSARIAERLPNARLVEIADAGGVMTYTQPAHVRSLIGELLREL